MQPLWLLADCFFVASISLCALVQPGKCQKKNVKLNLYHFERGGYSFIQEIAESLPLTNSEGTYDWEWSRKGQFFHLENRFDDDRYSVEIVTFDDGQNDQCQVYSPTFFLVVGLPGRTTRPVVTIQNHEEQPAMQGGNGGAVVAAVLIPLVAVGVIFICLRFYRQKQINLANNDNVARNAHPTTARPGSLAAEDDLAEVKVAGLQLEPVKKKQGMSVSACRLTRYYAFRLFAFFAPPLIPISLSVCRMFYLCFLWLYTIRRRIFPTPRLGHDQELRDRWCRC